MFKPSNNFLLTIPRRCFFLKILFVIVFCVCVCHTISSVSFFDLCTNVEMVIK